jgi:hypothetical protein
MRITGVVTGVKAVREGGSDAAARDKLYRLTLRTDEDQLAEAFVRLDRRPAVGERFVCRDRDDQTIEGKARVAPLGLPETSGDDGG